ncbi:MAG: hypothetical protein AAB531_05680 [Patescibacteria group bacterium]
MSSSSLVFGDIFVYENEEYIFLASTSAQIYTAKILDIDLSRRVNKAYDEALKKSKEIKLKNLLYCFVILTTQELKNRIASLARTDGHRFEAAMKKSNISLNKKDLISLKDEAVSSRGVPIILKELISTLELDD